MNQTPFSLFIQQALKYGFTLFGLPKTGQTTSLLTGDDGYYKKGWATKPNRFVDNGDGTVTDNATGLMFVKEPQKIIPGAVGVHLTNQIQAARGNWAASVNYVPGDVVYGVQRYDGYIASRTTSTVTVSGGPGFTAADLGRYVYCGASAAGYIKKILNSTQVMVSSSGSISPGSMFLYSRFVCVVAHTSVGPALWQDIAAHPEYWRETIWTASSANLTTPSQNVIDSAIAFCENLDYAGHQDWRLPNFHEIASLLLLEGAAGPYINASFFPNAVSGNYLSSTRVPPSFANSLIFSFIDGSVTSSAATVVGYIRPVRNA